MPSLAVHDFRVTDRFLAETDPDAGDGVYLGPNGDIAFPFVVWRTVSGPGGWYVDECAIRDATGAVVASWEKKYEIEGESVIENVVDELRHVRLPGPGNYTLRYSVYAEHTLDVPFSVVAEDPPYTGTAPGAFDAALSKSTICWVAAPAGSAKPVWFGYKDGLVYVLVGPQEQDVPGLVGATHAQVIARSKDKQSLVAEVECRVRVLPKDEAWDSLARDVMIGRRLNLTDGERALDRWRETCEIVQLIPLPAPRG